LQGKKRAKEDQMDLREVPLDQITVSEFNTRKDLGAGTEDSSLDDLAASIKEKGLLNPIMLRATASGSYELIAGQRRLLACKRLGMTSIPALIRSQMDDGDAVAISLIENVHRAEMNPLDKARAFAALRDRYGGDIARVSKETGIGAQTVRRYLALLLLPDEIQERISTSEGPARVESLALLTRTFSRPEDVREAYDKTVGFSQEIQKQIIKATGGDISRLDQLVAQAQEGAFDTKFCRGLAGKLMCEYIPQELAESVVELVEQWKRQQPEPGDVRDAAKKQRLRG
jgi:ParB family transcriptional regulator, chromosome partitioning protein